MRYAVAQLTRNNENYFKTAFAAVHAAVRGADWYFVENDSIDNTVALAQRYGQVLSLSLPAIHPLTSRCTTRTDRLSFLRNKAINWIYKFADYDFVIWVDTNVSFSANTIDILKRIITEDATIGMACANTIERGFRSHYYDTYALNSDICLWSSCDMCTGSYASNATVDVNSAFGGLCIIRKEAISTFAAANNECEHVYMCQQVRNKGFRVVVVGRAQAIWTP
jgi:hypothetical protein